jgi:hypothetical protein
MRKTPRPQAMLLAPTYMTISNVIEIQEYADKLEKELAAARAEVYVECARIVRNEKVKTVINLTTPQVAHNWALEEAAEAIERAAKEGK